MSKDCAPVLPAPPSDEDRDSYWQRGMWLLLPMLVAVPIGVGYSAFRFATAEWMFWPYMIVVVLFAGWAVITFVVGVGSRDEDPEEHRARVAGGAPPSPIDVFLPVCGEPIAILRNTWTYVQRLQWDGPLRVYVLDDKDDPAVAAMTREFGFEYVARRENGWMKKAGNLRHAYLRTQGEFIAIFDADFCPRSDYLRELMPYFDGDVGIVQSPQHFRVTADQTWIERGAGAVQEFFYRVVQVSRQKHGGAICVGTCAIYRREALAANDGPALIEHSEDVHTGIELRRHGWHVRYVPVCLATGACPGDLEAFFRQQYRWCMGSMSLLRSGKFWRMSMPITARLCYVSGFAYYITTAVMVAAGPLVPLALLSFTPERVHVTAYIPLSLGLLYMYVIFPLWHRCRYGPETLSVKLLLAWSHAFALVDIVRGRPMGWAPTGAKPKADYRFKALQAVLVLYSGLGLAWVGLAAYRAMEQPWEFAPMLATGMVYFAVVARPLPRPRLGRQFRVVAVTAALTFALTVVPAAVAHAKPVGVVLDAKAVPSWSKRVGTRPPMVAFYDSLAGNPEPELSALRKRKIRRAFITLEPNNVSTAKVAAGAADEQITGYARKLKKFGGRVYVRYAHEMNGYWYPWSFDASKKHDGPGYVAAWRRMYRLMKRAAPRVKLIWSPNVLNPNWSDERRAQDFAPWWPGGDYVDAVGLTTVEFKAQQSFSVLREPTRFSWWSYLRLLHDLYGKPVWLTEMNANRVHGASWFGAMFDTMRVTPWIAGGVVSQAPTHGGDPKAMDWDLSRSRAGRGVLRRAIKW